MKRVPPTSNRATALREAFRRAQAWGPIPVPGAVGLTAGFIASFVVDALLRGAVDTPLRQLVDATVFSIVAAPVWLVVQRRDVRQAHEVMTWLNGWETERWQGEIGRRLTVVPRATPGMLERLPDTMGLRPLRIELLAVRGELDEARERLAQLPTDTPWQRFEQAALAEWIAWWADEPGDRGPMAEAATQIEDEERRVAAQVMLAAAEARRAAVSGADAMAPLATARPMLDKRPGRYAFPYTGGVVAIVVLIGAVASVAVVATSAALR
ncbi:MAG: hypothetical protein ACRDGV_02540 [Candidatus Limnocylindria bacterium]